MLTRPEACNSAEHSNVDRRRTYRETSMLTFILWLILLILCWPLALLALVLYPLIWLLSLPFRALGIAVEGFFAFLRAVIFLPARVLHGPRA
jgi:hypothetical protein